MELARNSRALHLLNKASTETHGGSCKTVCVYACVFACVYAHAWKKSAFVRGELILIYLQQDPARAKGARKSNSYISGWLGFLEQGKAAPT